MSNMSFGDQLRAAALMLANGERDEIFMSDFQLQTASGREAIHPGHLRTTMGRAVRHLGGISVKRVKADDERPDGYIATFVAEPKRKILTNDDAAAIEAKAVAKFAKRILSIMPNVMHLEGAEREGAIEGINLYQKMIREMVEGE